MAPIRTRIPPTGVTVIAFPRPATAIRIAYSSVVIPSKRRAAVLAARSKAGLLV